MFDLLYLDGLDLRRCALIDRKRALAALLDRIEGPIRLSEHQQGHGSPLYRSACRMQLEGLVSKRAQSRYQSRRTADWVPFLPISKRPLGKALAGGLSVRKAAAKVGLGPSTLQAISRPFHGVAISN